MYKAVERAIKACVEAVQERDTRIAALEAQLAERVKVKEVKPLIEELKQATHYDCIPSRTEQAIDKAIAFLSALAAAQEAGE